MQDDAPAARIRATIASVRIVFMGSPDFAVPSLRALAEIHQVAGVMTQPDRPAGRGRGLRPPPVKTAAIDLGLSISQPTRVSSPEALDQIRGWAPELIVVAAFGQILRPVLLDLPKYGCINVHASLLPRWRGAAPVPAAILGRDDETGITIMRMDPGIDTGPILAQQREPILRDDTAGALLARLAHAGAALLAATLPEYVAGRLEPQPQDDRLATYAPLIGKRDGALDLNAPAADLERRVRAYDPWPGCFVYWGPRRLGIRRARVAAAAGAPPGRAVNFDGLPGASTPAGLLVFEIVQPEGRAAMTGGEFLRGARGFEGSTLTTTPGEAQRPGGAPESK